MKKKLLLLFTVVLSLSGYSQITFEKGYFITNSGEKTECLIKNIDWNTNPIDFEYKRNENSVAEVGTIKLIKEFEIYNSSKYYREKVSIDTSSKNIHLLTTVQNPIFIEKEVFLKVLVQGKANLFSYEDLDLKGYFHNIDNGKIEQLIYKEYIVQEDKIAKNEHFKKQIFDALKCPTITVKRLSNLEFKKSSLTKLYLEYNKCQNSESVDFEEKEKEKEKRDLFNLTLRPRINNSSMKMNNFYSNSGDIDLGKQTSFGFGVEFEYILPFNKNKWSISIEPTYQNYKSENTTSETLVSGGELNSTVKYNSIEIPTTFRHYFFLNKNSKIFVNVSIVIDLHTSSSLELTREDDSFLRSLDTKSQMNWAIGLGYKLNDKYSLEIRTFTKRNITSDYYSIETDYKNLSFIIGYTIF